MKTTMNRINPILACVLCACVVNAAAAEPHAGQSQASPARTLPNIVLLYIDDLGYGDLSAYGCTDIPTPNIDTLAAEGVRFTASYITNPPCCPSRCSLMIGQYAQRFGKYGMSRGLPLPEDRPTLARFLSDRGYVTGETVWLTDYDGDSMIEFIERHKNETFSLHWSPEAVHSLSIEAPERLMERTQAKGKRPNLATEYPDIVTQLAAKHAAWATTLSPLGEIPEVHDEALVVPTGHGWTQASAQGD